MIYVKFIHPNLETDATYQAWVSKRDAGRTVDWRDLFNWLGAHPRAPYQSDDVLKGRPAKCWFSEMWVAARHSKDVEHFRPKNSGDRLSNKQRTALKKKLGYIPDQEPDFATGYKWLEFEPINYRLASPHVNRGGAKHTHFPLTDASPRLPDGQMPDFHNRVEFPYLLDPSHPGDRDMLLVLPDGSIVPRDPEGPAPTVPLPSIWDTPTVRNIRAWLSIIVYQLDHVDLRRGRKNVYKETQEAIDMLTLSLKFGQTQDWIRDATRTLFRLGAAPSLFALAARCAMQKAISSLDRSDTLEKAVAQTLETLLATYTQLET